MISSKSTLIIDVFTLSSNQVNKLRLEILDMLYRKKKEGFAKIDGVDLIIECPPSEIKNVNKILEKADPDLKILPFSFWDFLKSLLNGTGKVEIGIGKVKIGIGKEKTNKK